MARILGVSIGALALCAAPAWSEDSRDTWLDESPCNVKRSEDVSFPVPADPEDAPLCTTLVGIVELASGDSMDEPAFLTLSSPDFGRFLLELDREHGILLNHVGETLAVSGFMKQSRHGDPVLVVTSHRPLPRSEDERVWIVEYELPELVEASGGFHEIVEHRSAFAP